MKHLLSWRRHADFGAWHRVDLEGNQDILRNDDDKMINAEERFRSIEGITKWCLRLPEPNIPQLKATRYLSFLSINYRQRHLEISPRLGLYPSGLVYFLFELNQWAHISTASN